MSTLVAVRDLRTAAPGDLLLHDDEIFGVVIAGRPGEIRVELTDAPAGKARWAWSLSRIATNRGTVPVLAGMRRALEDHGVVVGDRFHVVREV